jgi:peptidoglycan/LPS O-acetylase OafA/YrhL
MTVVGATAPTLRSPVRIGRMGDDHREGHDGGELTANGSVRTRVPTTGARPAGPDCRHPGRTGEPGGCARMTQDATAPAATAAKPRRSLYLDALRAVALARVVVYHASSYWWVTAFTAMPLMFFVAGSLFAASLERRPGPQVVADRFRRILFPYWLYLLVIVAIWAAVGALGEVSLVDWIGLVMPVIAPGGPTGPGVGTPLEFTWLALWYLQFHLVLALVGTWFRKVQRRHPRVLWGTLGALFALAFLAGSGAVVVIFYLSCWLLGYHQHDGHLEASFRRYWKPACAVAGPLGLAIFIAYDDSNLRLGAVGAAALGVFWLLLAIGLQPTIEPWLHSRGVPAVLNWFSQRSLTIYLWHMVALYTLLELGLPGSSNAFGRVVWCAALTVVAVVAAGWAEDVAARRKPVLWPRLPQRAAPRT